MLKQLASCDKHIWRVRGSFAQEEHQQRSGRIVSLFRLSIADLYGALRCTVSTPLGPSACLVPFSANFWFESTRALARTVSLSLSEPLPGYTNGCIFFLVEGRP